MNKEIKKTLRHGNARINLQPKSQDGEYTASGDLREKPSHPSKFGSSVLGRTKTSGFNEKEKGVRVWKRVTHYRAGPQHPGADSVQPTMSMRLLYFGSVMSLL